MKSIKLLWLLVSFLILHSCNTSKNNNAITIPISYEQSYFDQNALLKHLKELSSDKYQGRQTGTEGANLAKMYIKNAFIQHEVSPFVPNFEQVFETTINKKTVEATNVLGVIKGTKYPAKYIVISAHYDHLGTKKGKIYNGADDNASGVSALLAFAEFFKKNQPEHSVILAAFDAEEIGLKGATYFVEKAQKELIDIVFNINMDMIGRSENNEIYAIGQLTQKELQPLVAAIELPENFSIAKGHEGNDGRYNWMDAADHAAFYQVGIPILYFGVEDHEDYHKPSDDFENIDKDFYIKAVEVIIKTFTAVDAFYK